MKKPLLLLVLSSYFLVLLAPAARGQKYEMRFEMPKHQPGMYYIGYHYRDELVPLDSVQSVPGNSSSAEVVAIFKGNRKWETGIYVLYRQGDKKPVTDFTIDGSQRFTIHLSPSDDVITDMIKGSEANKAMFLYKDKLREANNRSREIEKMKKDPATKAQAEKDMEALRAEMESFEENYLAQNRKYLCARLTEMMRHPEVPDEVEDKPLYFRSHYWDGVDLKDHSLVRTPDLFNKMNYYFFGVLYHADADTIMRYTDRLLESMNGDTLMMRYVLDFIMPRYYRSTKNVGWDAVWCHLVRTWYLSGRCPWATRGDIVYKQKEVAKLEQSLIGAVGQELWMADTNQSSNPDEWISSHRFPQKYVILWFWDPDCHHCQEQTATLKTLYDSLSAAGNKIFEVYAVGYEADVAKWKKYVRDHHLPFVNVGGSNVNIDYQVAYNVHGAPTMIILDEHRRIIMNKVLPTNQILPFLKRHEEKLKGKN